MRKVSVMLLQAIIALLVVLFFANFGRDGSVISAFHGSYVLLRDTLKGQNIHENYYYVYPPAIWYTTRFVLLSTIFAGIIGLALAVVRARTKRRWLKAPLETVIALFESIPDAMYVVLTVIFVLFLFERYGIELPVFPDTFRPNFIDTVIPAIALALPAGLYLQRILSMQMHDEKDSQYMVTAQSKGLSNRQVFYRHLLPNAYPTFIRNLPIVAGLIISTAIFAEFFFDYQGLLFHLLIASGWGIESKFMFQSYMLSDIPMYEPGTVWAIGSLLVVLWLVINLASILVAAVTVPKGLTITPPPHRTRVQRLPVVIGGLMLLVIIVIGLDPSLVTPFHAGQSDYSGVKTGTPWPFFPGAKHPFGTDDIGRDMLALAAYSVWTTLVPVVLVTLIALIGSLGLATLAYATQSRFLSGSIDMLGRLLTSIPVLYVAFLLLYPRNHDALSLANQTSADIWHQVIICVVGIGILEIGRSSYGFYQAIQGWAQFGFMEGVESIGRRKVTVLWTDLRPWLVQYMLEFCFLEFARVLSLFVQLAALTIFLGDAYGIVAFTLGVSHSPGVVPAFNTWFAVLGEIGQNYTFISYAWLLWAPVAFLLFTMIGANLVGRGLRGR